MRTGLLLAGVAAAALLVPAGADAAKFKTTHGNTCVATPAGSAGGGSATYSLTVEAASCGLRLKFVESLIYLNTIEGSDQHLKSDLDHVNSTSHAVTGPAVGRYEYAIVLRVKRVTGSERFKRNTGPPDCRTTNTFTFRDTVTCNTQMDL